MRPATTVRMKKKRKVKMMNYNELYKMCDEIYDALEELHSKITENDYVRGEVGRLMSEIEDVKGYLEDDEHDDTDATLRDVGQWLGAQQRVS